MEKFNLSITDLEFGEHFAVAYILLVSSELGFIRSLIVIAMGKQEKETCHGMKKNPKSKSDLMFKSNLLYIMLGSLRCAFLILSSRIFFPQENFPINSQNVLALGMVLHSENLLFMK